MSIPLFLEVRKPETAWTAPEDIDINDLNAWMCSWFKSKEPPRFGPLVVFADGSVWRIAKPPPMETLFALATIAGAEDVTPNELEMAGMFVQLRKGRANRPGTESGPTGAQTPPRER